MAKNSIIRLIIVLSLLVAALIWKPLFILIIPGILLLFVPLFEEEVELANLLIYVVGISLSFWVCSFWFLKFIPLSLTIFFISVVAITTSITAYCLFAKTNKYRISLKYHNFILILIFLFVLILRLQPMYFAIAPPGADMSMHTYITQIIIRANGVPNDYYPILAIDRFDSFPAGFHTLSALTSLVGGIAPFRSTFLITCITYTLVTLFLYVFLNRFVSWPFALISSIAFSFFTENPQGFTSWGGNPTILAIAFLILSISLLDRMKSNKWNILLTAIAFVSIMLTHTLIFIQTVYIFGVSFLAYFLLNKECQKRKWFKYLWLTAFFFIIVSAYLFTFEFGVTTPETIDWIKSWVRDGGHVWHGTASNFIWTIPTYIKGYIFGHSIFKYSLIICSIGLICASFTNLKRAIQYAAFMVMIVLLILNAQYWVLPFSYAIYPERAATMIIIPLSLFFAYGLEIPLKKLKDAKINNIFLLSTLLKYGKKKTG